MARYIHYAMKANKISPRANARLDRIKKISRILKGMFLVYFIVAGLFAVIFATRPMVGPGTWTIYNRTYGNLSDVPIYMKFVSAMGMGLYLFGAIIFYRLLNLYGQGIVFSPRNVQLVRRLGYLAFANGLLGVCVSVIGIGGLVLPTLIFETPGSPWIICGLFIIMVSLMIDEGCQMRKEQELTV